MTDAGPTQDPFAPPPAGGPPSTWPPPQHPWQPPPWQQNPLQQTGWQPYGWWQPPRKTNALAIAALITGIVALVPVSIGLAIGALKQTRRRNEAGTRLAVGGIVASGVWTLLIALITVVGLNRGFGFSSREGNLADVASQTVGSCLNEDPPAVSDCSLPHDLEVFYAAPLPPRPWPGEHDVDSAADDICYDTFEDYVGSSYDDSDLDYTFFAPSKSEWLAGRRTVVCVVTPADEYLVGSVKNSGR
jgi:hypothetical protein